MSDVPLASYEDPRWIPANKNIVGSRGFSGKLATLTTTNGIVITAENGVYGNDPPIKIQYAVLAPGSPGLLYEDGYPARFVQTPDLGFQLIMKKAGSFGNYYTLTLVDPGHVAPLSIRRPAVKDIVIRLARSTTAITTTPAQLIAAINGDPELSTYMIALVSSAGPAQVAAMTRKPFTGGSDVPGLVLVSLANTDGVASTATGASVGALVNGSRYVKSSGTFTGTVAAYSGVLTGPAAATPGTANRGGVSEQYLSRRNAWDQKMAPGIPLGKNTNRTIEPRSSRLGAVRTWQRVARQDRFVTNASPLSLQTDRLAALTLG
jgi:hypothetical protein